MFENITNYNIKYTIMNNIIQKRVYEITQKKGTLTEEDKEFLHNNKEQKELEEKIYLQERIFKDANAYVFFKKEKSLTGKQKKYYDDIVKRNIILDDGSSFHFSLNANTEIKYVIQYGNLITEQDIDWAEENKYRITYADIINFIKEKIKLGVAIEEDFIYLKELETTIIDKQETIYTITEEDLEKINFIEDFTSVELEELEEIKNKEQNYLEIKKKEQIRKSTINRAKRKIFELVQCNADLDTFLTLTVEENLEEYSTNRDKLVEYFNQFISVLSRDLKKIKSDFKFKYVAILEKHKKKSKKNGLDKYHIHMLCNLPVKQKPKDIKIVENYYSIGKKKIYRYKVEEQKENEQFLQAKYWKLGYTDIEKIDKYYNNKTKEVETATRLGAYMVKYVTKDLAENMEESKNKSIYLCSKGLDKPVNIYLFDNLVHYNKNKDYIEDSTKTIRKNLDKDINTREDYIKYYTLTINNEIEEFAKYKNFCEDKINTLFEKDEDIKNIINIKNNMLEKISIKKDKIKFLIKEFENLDKKSFIIKNMQEDNYKKKYNLKIDNAHYSNNYENDYTGKVTFMEWDLIKLGIQEKEETYVKYDILGILKKKQELVNYKKDYREKLKELNSNKVDIKIRRNFKEGKDKKILEKEKEIDNLLKELD